MKRTPHATAPALLAATAALGACLHITGSARAAPPGGATNLSVAGAAVQVDFDAGAFSLGAQPLLEWVRRSATIVSGYYGRFPTTRLELQLQPQSGGGVQGGQTFGARGGFMRVRVGR